MSENTKIEWCDSTFNPWTGCTKVGPGCDNCYAEGWAKRSGLVRWGPGAERRRTSAANWQKQLQWNAERFVECTECGWRGEQRKAHSGGTQCPACSFGRETLKPARRRVFCASLADVFDNEVPDEWRSDLFDLIQATPNLDWLLVTKRIGNVPRLIREVRPGDWLQGRRNVWLGITVVNQEEADRDIPKLLSTPAAVRFLSMEPLLGAVNLRHLNVGREANELDCLSHPWTWEKEVELWRDTDDEWEEQFEDHFGIAVSEAAGPMHPTVDWVIVGGESGPKARPMHPQWVRDIRDQCATAGVPFLFKQWGEWAPASHGHGGKCGAWNGDAFLPGFGDLKAPDNNMTRAGKNACGGRLLDGQEHNGYPVQQRAEAGGHK